MRKVVPPVPAAYPEALREILHLRRENRYLRRLLSGWVNMEENIYSRQNFDSWTYRMTESLFKKDKK